MPDRWWTTFDDPALNRQIGRSLDGSFALAAALERVRAARALARREASDLWPDVDGIALVDSTFATEGPDQANYVLGFDSSYQVDLWGQIQSRVDAERLRASATREEYLAAALTISADVARVWFSLIEAHAQLELLEQQVDTNRTGLELQELRFGIGQVRSADVLRQRQLVESTLEQTVIVQSRIEVLEHLLAVLEGRPPQDASYEPGSELPALPPLPDTGLPSELLRRRPDVRRDFLLFQAADRDLAAAVTALYPRISLTGAVTTAAESPEDLFRRWFVSIGGQMIAPLIDGGQRRAEVDRTTAVARQRFNEYGETTLIAFREVEDSLARERYLIRRIERLNKQIELAEAASAQLREQYLLTDETDYLAVLSATTEAQRLQRETLAARLELVLTRISLYLALAGGFQSRTPSPATNAFGAGGAPSSDAATADGELPAPDRATAIPFGFDPVVSEPPDLDPPESGAEELPPPVFGIDRPPEIEPDE
jgi:NodT family efflux transporter outer membrane factor (OMF) lipoprotein